MNVATLAIWYLSALFLSYLPTLLLSDPSTLRPRGIVTVSVGDLFALFIFDPLFSVLCHLFTTSLSLLQEDKFYVRDVL